MKISKSQMFQHWILTAALSAFIWTTGSTSWAAETEKNPPPKSGPSQEKRIRMAESMEKMAACLRSEKTMETCHEEMKAHCHESEDACPMMGKGMHGMMMKKGMKHHKKGESQEKSETDEHAEHH